MPWTVQRPPALRGSASWPRGSSAAAASAQSREFPNAQSQLCPRRTDVGSDPVVLVLAPSPSAPPTRAHLHLLPASPPRPAKASQPRSSPDARDVKSRGRCSNPGQTGASLRPTRPHRSGGPEGARSGRRGMLLRLTRDSALRAPFHSEAPRSLSPTPGCGHREGKACVTATQRHHPVTGRSRRASRVASGVRGPPRGRVAGPGCPGGLLGPLLPARNQTKIVGTSADGGWCSGAAVDRRRSRAPSAGDQHFGTGVGARARALPGVRTAPPPAHPGGLHALASVSEGLPGESTGWLRTRERAHADRAGFQQELE